jgi:hypothetical protein
MHSGSGDGCPGCRGPGESSGSLNPGGARPPRRGGILSTLLATGVLVGLAGLLAPASAAAGDEGDGGRREFAVNRLTSKWLVEVGGSWNAFDTSAAWSPRGLSGAVIILEDALGLDEQNSTLVIRAVRRFKRGHSVELLVEDLNRSATRAIDHEIDWGDYVYRAEGSVTSKLDTRIFKIRWKYDFSDSERLNAGFSAGLSTFQLGLKLEGEARLEDETGELWVDGVVEGASAIAPVPVIGFYLEYALSPRWVLRFDSDAMDLNLGSQSGRLLETSVAVEYVASDLVGVGLSLSSMDLEYRSDEGDERFGAAYRIKSVGAHLSFAF